MPEENKPEKEQRTLSAEEVESYAWAVSDKSLWESVDFVDFMYVSIIISDPTLLSLPGRVQ